MSEPDKLTITRAIPADASAILTLKRAAWLAAYPSKAHGVTREDIDKKLLYQHQGFKKTGVETPEKFDKEQEIKLLPETEMVLKTKEIL